MMSPKISIIVPVYNVEKYIVQCLDSLITQTLPEIEILCVDDCGTDNSMQIVEDYAQKDSRIRILHHSTNQGISASRNTALNHATAPYIMCCDSDDWYEPTMCERLYQAITQNPVEMAICGTQIHYEANQEHQKSDNEYFGISFKAITKVNNAVINKTDVAAWNKIYKKEIFLKHQIQWPERLKYEDNFVFYTYTCWINAIYFIPEKLYNYRRRAGSIMNKTFQMNTSSALDHLKIAFFLFDYYKKHNLYNNHLIRCWQFIGMSAHFSYHHSNMEYKLVALEMLRNFIAQYPIPAALPNILKQDLQHCLNPYKFMPYKSYFGELFVKEKNQFQKRYKLCGLVLHTKDR